MQSAVNQTYKNLQILVIDGAHDPDNEKFVKKINKRDQRVHYIYANDPIKKSGMYGDVQEARNVGVKLASGKYVAMLDDDDEWSTSKIAHQVYYAETYNAALVSCQTIIKGRGHIDKPGVLPDYKTLLKSFNISCMSSFFINREKLKEIGGFKNSRTMHEYDIALKLAKNKEKIIVIPLPLMVKDPFNETKRKYYLTSIRAIFDMYNNYGLECIKQLGARGFIFNLTKSSLLVALNILGMLIKEKSWIIIYKLKNMYQEKI